MLCLRQVPLFGAHVHRSESWHLPEQLAIVVYCHECAWLFPLGLHARQTVVRRVVLQVPANVEASVWILECDWAAVGRILLDAVLLGELALRRGNMFAALCRGRHDEVGGALVREA